MLCRTPLALLSYFMRHPNRGHSRTGLIEVLGKGERLGDDRTLDACVARLDPALPAHGAPDCRAPSASTAMSSISSEVRRR
jgi:DNA-binding response OmpR family regulator